MSASKLPANKISLRESGSSKTSVVIIVMIDYSDSNDNDNHKIRSVMCGAISFRRCSLPSLFAQH